MKSLPRPLFASVAVLILAAMPVQSIAASAHTRSTSPHGQVSLREAVAAPVVSRSAHVLGRKQLNSPMSLSLSLAPRHQAALDAFIRTRAIHGQYLTQQQFDRRFGASPAQVKTVRDWIKAHGFSITYASSDGLTFGITGSTRQVERSFATRIDRYRYGTRTFYSPMQAPSVPARLGMESVVGFNNLLHPRTLGLRRHDVRTGGYYPVDYRVAYDIYGHNINAAGQSIGLTLWGHRAYDSDFAQQAARQKADTTVADPALKSCTGCNKPDTIEWIPVDGVDNQTGEDLGEVSMDAEFSHGVAIHSHLRFYLARAGTGQDLVDAISKAANDPKIHIVSNSWGVPGITSAKDAFVKATTTSFKHAVAVGTTFYFSSGDNSENSGCPRDPKTKLTELCGNPLYPADSPWVVSVGGTNLQVNRNVTWNQESVWNSDPNDNFAGGGTGCASIFSRPSWQKKVVNTAATCDGRAFPDISADGDPETGAHVFLNNGSDGTIGGTSLAAPLNAGMAAVTNAYLQSQHVKLPGFAAPVIYKLGKSKLYNTYFHDVRCGYNGQPAAPKWDEASGFGSIDWYRFAQGYAGKSIKPFHPDFSKCTPISKATDAADPFDGYLAWPVYGKNESMTTATTAQDDSSTNPMRAFHTKSYSSFGVKGSVVQKETYDIDNLEDLGSYAKTATLYYLGSYTKNNIQAAALVNDARSRFPNYNPTIGGPNCLVNYAFPNAPVNCWFYGVVKMPNGKAADYIIFQEQNVVIEILAVAKRSDVSDQSIEQNWLDGSSLVLSSAIDQINTVTNSGYSGKKYAKPRAGEKIQRRLAPMLHTLH